MNESNRRQQQSGVPRGGEAEIQQLPFEGILIASDAP
jgi:hypothetical protein